MLNYESVIYMRNVQNKTALHYTPFWFNLALIYIYFPPCKRHALYVCNVSAAALCVCVLGAPCTHYEKHLQQATGYISGNVTDQKDPCSLFILIYKATTTKISQKKKAINIRFSFWSKATVECDTCYTRLFFFFLIELHQLSQFVQLHAALSAHKIQNCLYTFFFIFFYSIHSNTPQYLFHRVKSALSPSFWILASLCSSSCSCPV